MTAINTYLTKNYKKIIGWGTGGYYERYAKKLGVEFDYLVDNNQTKWGSIIDNAEVCSPFRLMHEVPGETIIIVFSSFYEDIKNEILQFGDFYTITGYQILSLEKYLINNETEELLEIDEFNKEIIISISRNNFALYIGGTSKFIREQMEIFIQEDLINLHLFWQEYNIKHFQGFYLTIIKNGIEKGIYSIHDFLSKDLKIKGIIIHNLIGLDYGILEDILAKYNNSKLIYYIHDFSCICSNIKLMFNDEFYCKSFESRWEICLNCENLKNKEKIFKYHLSFFSSRDVTLIAPSNNTRNIILKSFALPIEKVKVIEHQTYCKTSKSINNSNSKLKLAYVGYKHKHKGWEEFKQLARDFAEEYDFYCFGMSDETIDGVKYVDVSFIEDGELAMTKKLREHSIDIALLWSVWPETYSYTYYESYAAGLYIITNELSGNIADQVLKNNNGVVLKNYNELSSLLSNQEELKQKLKHNNSLIDDLTKNSRTILDVLGVKRGS
ncbi:hypothetical protein [Neobacillus sp.]|uniref:hypothetical protein n=1 Tax=Neobacillus sp. TaxID=2675273 RepID=UPI0035B5693A